MLRFAARSACGRGLQRRVLSAEQVMELDGSMHGGSEVNLEGNGGAGGTDERGQGEPRKELGRSRG